MTRITLILTTILIFSTITSRSNADDVQFLKQGTPAPQDGYLFPPDRAQEVKKTIIERDGLKQINQLLQDQNGLLIDNQTKLQAKFTLSDQRSDTLAQQLNESRTVTEWQKWAYVGLGILITGVASYGIKQVAR